MTYVTHKPKIWDRKVGSFRLARVKTKSARKIQVATMNGTFSRIRDNCSFEIMAASAIGAVCREGRFGAGYTNSMVCDALKGFRRKQWNNNFIDRNDEILSNIMRQAQ